MDVRLNVSDSQFCNQKQAIFSGALTLFNIVGGNGVWQHQSVGLILIGPWGKHLNAYYEDIWNIFIQETACDFACKRSCCKNDMMNTYC